MFCGRWIGSPYLYKRSIVFFAGAQVSAMAGSGHQPLLDSPKSSRSFSLCVIVSLVAVCSGVLLATFRRSSSFHAPLTGHCDHAHDMVDSCMEIVSEFTQLRATKFSRGNLIEDLLLDSVSRINDAARRAESMKLKVNDEREQAALLDCVELMDLSIDRVTKSIAAMKNFNIEDAHTWLSSVLTNHMTCLDELQGQGLALAAMDPLLKDLVLRARTVLAVFVSEYSIGKKKCTFSVNREFPSWVTGRDRKLLQSSAENIAADVVVAKDGSGKYKTVTEAVAAAPTNSKTRYVIYVKKGTYKENVQIGKTLKNIMLVGDGMTSTLITGSLNVVDGSTTFNSATVAAVGDGFIAQDIWFQNSAGAIKHQAVALRVGADLSVINRCQIDAYQDTLYAHSNRQFYKDSNITGTVDFIFGNAAAVFQTCNLIPRAPMKSQKNMVTAQGRTDPNQNTATSIQKCNIVASADLQPVISSYPTYLGRPWKAYSRTVVMQSYLGSLINSDGWSVWDGDFALKTLYYGEYKNTGPGSNTAKRVTWEGYHVITDPSVAKLYTVTELIQGDQWLSSTGVTFTAGL